MTACYPQPLAWTPDRSDPEILRNLAAAGQAIGVVARPRGPGVAEMRLLVVGTREARRMMRECQPR